MTPSPDDQVTQEPYCDTRLGIRKKVIVVKEAQTTAVVVMTAQGNLPDVFSKMKLRHSAQSDAYTKSQGLDTCIFTTVARVAAAYLLSAPEFHVIT